MGPGDFFGEIAALTGSPRTANVIADEETDLLEVPKASLQQLLELPGDEHADQLEAQRAARADLDDATSCASPARTRATCATCAGAGPKGVAGAKA